ncbi:MAG TPA: fatty acid desaturase CarF family protein [Gemmatimonas sp.]|nr:fatty acid desaturase CarF family protein [Gemmatimonas sp.]
MTGAHPTLPALETPGIATRAFALASIVGATGLVVLHGVRLFAASDALSWWAVPVVLLGMATADFLSGVVHWGADTWGSETMPVLGKRLLHPFRVHHINPADFLRRHWIDTNGDVATIVVIALGSAFLIPTGSVMGRAVLLFVIALCATTLPTNQVHQWAHMRNPPQWVARLQRAGVLLGGSQHAMHHDPPYLTNYCIALGWCNPLLVRLRLFQRMERLVTRITGAKPRADEERLASLAAHI